MSSPVSYQPSLDHHAVVNRAIEQMKLAGAMSERYYDKPILLCYSGGKDSDVLLWLAKESGINFEVQYSKTSVDAPETVLHVKSVFSELRSDGIKASVHMPTLKGKPITMWTLIARRNMPPTRIIRYCCQTLKETGGKGRAIATGVRRSESVARSGRKFAENISSKRRETLDFEDAASLFNDAGNFVEHDSEFMRSCRIRGKTSFQPIIEFTDSNVWQLIDEQGIRVNPLYEMGYSRVGCIGCPFASRKERDREFEHYPAYRNAYLRAFAKMLERRREKGLQTEWSTPDEVMEWWLGE